MFPSFPFHVNFWCLIKTLIEDVPVEMNILYSTYTNHPDNIARRWKLRWMKKATIPNFLSNFRSRPNLTSFERFQLLIRKQSLYEEGDKVVETLLHVMAKEEIVHIEQKEGGTQLKLIMDFESNGQAMFKPMR